MVSIVNFSPYLHPNPQIERCSQGEIHGWILSFLWAGANKSDPASVHELNRSFGYFWNAKSTWGAFGDAIEIEESDCAPNRCTSTSNLSSLRLQILTHNYVLRFQRHWCSVRQFIFQRWKTNQKIFFCLAEVIAFQNQLLRASCPEKPNHSSLNGFLGWVVDFNKVKHWINEAKLIDDLRVKFRDEF